MKKLILATLLFSSGIFSVYAQQEIKTKGNVRLLYVNCGNRLEVEEPRIDQPNHYTLKAEGAIASFDSVQPGVIVILPTGMLPKVTLSIYRDNQLIARSVYGITLIPKVTVVFRAEDVRFDSLSGLKLNPYKTLSISVEGDPDFCSRLPRECKYKVNSWSVNVLRKGESIFEEKYNTETISTKPFIHTLKKGDVVKITVYEVIRTNYKGGREITKLQRGNNPWVTHIRVI